MWASISPVITALVSVGSLVWAVSAEVRNASVTKHAARAETAARLLATLQAIGVGGIDKRLADSLAAELHSQQIRRLQEVIRVNTAEFERRAQRVGLPLGIHFVIGLYGALFLVASLGTVGSVARMVPEQQWIGYLFFAGLMLLFGGMILNFALAAYRRWISRGVRRNAGMYVTSLLETITTNYVGFMLWWSRIRARRSPSRLPAPAMLVSEASANETETAAPTFG